MISKYLQAFVEGHRSSVPADKLPAYDREGRRLVEQVRILEASRRPDSVHVQAVQRPSQRVGDTTKIYEGYGDLDLPEHRGHWR